MERTTDKEIIMLKNSLWAGVFGSENVLQSISICVFCQRSSQKLTFTLVPTETRARARKNL